MTVQAQKPAQTLYPDRYYAQYDSTAPQPAPVTGWWDMWGFEDVTALPPLSDLFPLTPEFWADHIQNPQTGRAVQNDQIIPYEPPQPPLPLKEQAQSAFRRARQEFSRLQMMGQTFGPQMQAYMRNLDAILSGTDTSSTTLPAAPNDPTV